MNADNRIQDSKDVHDAPPRAFPSLWSAGPAPAFPVSRTLRARSYDLVIVGAGISGALLAEALCDGRRSVLIIDKAAPATGSTAASTALIQHEIDTPLFLLSRALGPETANACWHRSVQGVERLCQLIADRGIDCGLERKQTLYLAGSQLDEEGMAEEAEARTATGIRAHYLRRACLKAQYGIDRPAAIMSDISASANPVQLTAALLKDVSRRGAEIVSPVEVTDVVPSGGRVHLLTKTGEYLSAAQVIFCTGYDFPTALANPSHTIASTWALATPPGQLIPAWLRHTLIWEASDPYLYIRTTPDGRIVAGGEDEDDRDAFLSKDKRAEKARIIRQKVSALLGIELPEADFSWSGAFGQTPHGLPHIGAMPGLPHVYACMGYGGNGMSFSMIAADLLRAELDGRPDPDARLFAFPEPDAGRLSA